MPRPNAMRGYTTGAEDSSSVSSYGFCSSDKSTAKNSELENNVRGLRLYVNAKQ